MFKSIRKTFFIAYRIWSDCLSHLEAKFSYIWIVLLLNKCHYKTAFKSYLFYFPWSLCSFEHATQCIGFSNILYYCYYVYKMSQAIVRWQKTHNILLYMLHLLMILLGTNQIYSFSFIINSYLKVLITTLLS